MKKKIKTEEIYPEINNLYRDNQGTIRVWLDRKTGIYKTSITKRRRKMRTQTHPETVSLLEKISEKEENMIKDLQLVARLQTPGGQLCQVNSLLLSAVKQKTDELKEYNKYEETSNNILQGK